MRFTIISAVNKFFGIGFQNQIPFYDSEDRQMFYEITTSNPNNAILMGKNTWNSIARVLPKRTSIVISKTVSNLPEGVLKFDSLAHFLRSDSKFDHVFIIGGSRIYYEVLMEYRFLIDNIYISHFNNTLECDVIFPYSLIPRDYVYRIPYQNFELEHVKYSNEYQYLDILRKIIREGEFKNDRTGVGTYSISDVKMKFDLRDQFPIITTKRMNYASILNELLFFISGETNTKILENKKVNIWRANTTRESHRKNNLPWKEYDMGPMYPFQWRHAGETYRGCDVKYQGIDQLKNVINQIRTDPNSRRHIISSWDVKNIDKMALPPCHVLIQFFVTGNYLDSILYQRSGDMFLGIPFNISSYSLLTMIIAKLCGLQARFFTHQIGDAHIYQNHMECVEIQLDRNPYPWPKIEFTDFKDIDQIRYNDVKLVNYQSYPWLQAEMAV